VFVAHSPSVTEKIVADVGVTSGSETLSEGGANVSIRLTPAFAYVRGSSSGLTTLFGMPAAQAKKLGRRWESWKPRTSQYSNLKTDLTMSSIRSLLPRTKGTRLSTAFADGAKLYVLKWTTAATSSVPKLSNTLTFPSQGATLPIEETETSATGVKINALLSRWGENVAVIAPPPAATVASLQITG